jgi:hypothetical protein
MLAFLIHFANQKYSELPGRFIARTPLYIYKKVIFAIALSLLFSTGTQSLFETARLTYYL